MLIARLCNRKLNRNCTVCLYIWKILTLCSLKVLELIFCLPDCWRFNKLRRTVERQQHLFADRHLHTHAHVAHTCARALMTKSTFPDPPVCLAGVARQQAAWTSHLICRTSKQPAAKAPPAAHLRRQNTHLAYRTWKQKWMFLFRDIFNGRVKISAVTLGKSRWNINIMTKRVFGAGIYYEDQLNQQDLTAKLNRKEKDKRKYLRLCSTAALERRRLRRITSTVARLFWKPLHIWHIILCSMRVYLQEMLPVSAEGESARRFPYCFYQAKCFFQGQGQRSSPRLSSNMQQQSCRAYECVTKKRKANSEIWKTKSMEQHWECEFIYSIKTALVSCHRITQNIFHQINTSR